MKILATKLHEVAQRKNKKICVIGVICGFPFSPKVFKICPKDTPLFGILDFGSGISGQASNISISITPLFHYSFTPNLELLRFLSTLFSGQPRPQAASTSQCYCDDAVIFSDHKETFSDDTVIFSDNRELFSDDGVFFYDDREPFSDDAVFFCVNREPFSDNGVFFYDNRELFSDDAVFFYDNRELFSYHNEVFSESIEIICAPPENFCFPSEIFQVPYIELKNFGPSKEFVGKFPFLGFGNDISLPHIRQQ